MVNQTKKKQKSQNRETKKKQKIERKHLINGKKSKMKNGWIKIHLS